MSRLSLAPLAASVLAIALARTAAAAPDPCRVACKSAKQVCVLAAKAAFAADRIACAGELAVAARRSCRQAARGAFTGAKADCKADKVACVAACGGGQTTTTLQGARPTTTIVPGGTTSTTTTTAPGGSTTSTTLPGPTCGDAEAVTVRGITNAHDVVRANPSLFGNGMSQPAPDPALAPLCYDAEIAAVAQAWADQCHYMHNAGRGMLGENIYAEAGPGTSSAKTPPDAVELWSAEAEFFEYATNSCDAPAVPGTCGHYTQVVWRETDSLGCGLRVCTANSPFPGFTTWTLVVCNYAPPGNVTVCAPPDGCVLQKPY